MANEVRIVIRADDQASKTFHDVGKSATGLGKVLGDVGKIAGGFLAANVISKGFGALTSGIGSSIQLASSLNESLSKTRVVFGETSKVVEDFAATAARSLGMSRGAALEATSTFGNFLQALGATRPVATEMSISMVKLAADLASFNNANPEEVLLALRSGLSGEAEPMRRFGVALSETAMKAMAAKLGLKAVNGELTEAQKIQARYAIIMEQTAMAQGDFARTSDGLANKQRIAAAAMDDLKTKIGQGLLPVQLALTNLLVDRFIPAISAAVAIVKPFAVAIKEIIAHTDNWRVSTEILPGPLRVSAAILAETILAIKDAIAQARTALSEVKRLFELGLGGGQIGGELDLITRAAFGAGKVLREDIIPVVEDARRALGLFLLGFQGGDAGGNLGRFGKAALEAGQALKPLVDAVAGIKTEIILGIAGALGVVLAGAFVALGIAAASAAISIIAATAPILAIAVAIAAAITAGILIVENWDLIRAKADELASVLREVWETKIPGPIRAYLEFLAGNVSSRITAFKDFVVVMFELLRDILQAVWAAIHGDWERVWEEVKSAAARIIPLIVAQVEMLFGDLPSKLFEIGRDAGRRLLEGIISTAGGVLSSIARRASGAIPGRAHGGPVVAGQPYLVGERGPELIVPHQSGVVMPNSQLRTGGGLAEAIQIIFQGPVTILAQSVEAAERSANDLGLGFYAGLRARGVA